MDCSRFSASGPQHAVRKHSLETAAFEPKSAKAILFLHVRGVAKQHHTIQKNTGSMPSTVLQYDFGASVSAVNVHSAFFETDAAKNLKPILFGQLHGNDISTAPKMMHE
jgi:hypothetical protein